MSLDMFGHIDDTFESTIAARIPVTGSYVNGKWVDASNTATPHTVNLQSASDKEIQALNDGGERIVDVRRVYVNDGILANIAPSDDWTFENVDGVFKTVKLDNRPWRNYCKIIVSRKDD